MTFLSLVTAALARKDRPRRSSSRRRPPGRPAAGLAVAAIGGLALAAPGLAQSRASSLDLAEMTRQSDLVFRGRVQQIEYVLSEPAGDEGLRIPHTFVTYRVDEVLAGLETGHTITLRFFGGLDLRDLTYHEATHIPAFDIGEEDILFVRDNGVAMCPLVADSAGRLRVINDGVYTDGGRALQLADDGSASLGLRYLFDEVSTTNIGGFVFTRDLAEGAANGPGDGVAAGALADRIAAVATLHAPQDRFASQDPAAPFSGPDMTPAAPPDNDATAPEEDEQAEPGEADRPTKKKR